MATTDSTAPVNGTYAYEANAYAANSNNATAYGAAQQQPTPASASTSEIPKDEVGWYFVEQYYTTLSKSPDRLYLFYNKRSQYVNGTEDEKVQVCIGQKTINDRIKELDFHDTKVRVTNVDSQGSDANIVIQVIGEISNKGQPHKRFVQTFVLAEQTNGYFVLNDIFRYLADETEDEEELVQEPEAVGVQEPVPSVAAPEPEAVSTEEVAKSEEDLVKVDEKLEEAVQEEPVVEAAPAPATVDEASPVSEAAEAAPVEEASTTAVAEETPNQEAEKPIAEEKSAEEKPKEPTPTPAAQKAAAAAAPAAAPKPAVPRTWASLAASAHKVALPAAPASNAPQTSAQPKASAAPAAAAAAPAASAVPAREPSPVNSQGEAAGWQSVTGHKKEQSRSQNQAPVTDSEPKRAYIKNVYSQVDDAGLKGAMSKFGEVIYLDISRQKNCAFVDFKTVSQFQAAVAANPHTVNGVDLIVEERRMRPASFAPFNRGGAPRGRGGINNGPRGGFNPRGRGGAVRGGRPAPQEA